MLNFVIHKRSIGQIIIVILIAISLILTTYTIIKASSSFEATSEKQNMRLFLQRIDERLQKEKGFIVAIDFINPLFASEKSWSIGNPGDKFNRSISEIGDDYLCFKERSEQGPDFIRCTPFSNIVSVDYMGG